MAGEKLLIKAADGNQFSGYLAKPQSGKGPGLLVIQEIFGVNSHIRDMVDLYAMEGFVALAPDVFFRIKPGVELGYSDAELQEGIGYAQKIDFKQLVQDLSVAARTLKSTDGVTGKIGAVGYCMGGFVTYLLAANNVIDAGVSYYGGGIDKSLDQSSSIKCPLLMHFAELDRHIPMSAVDTISNALKSKPEVKILTYPEVDHGFNCDQRSAYDRKAAMLAYARSATFLHKHLD